MLLKRPLHLQLIIKKVCLPELLMAAVVKSSLCPGCCASKVKIIIGRLIKVKAKR